VPSSKHISSRFKEISMQPLVKIFHTALLALLMIASQTVSVRAEELTYNPQAEEYVRAELLQSGVVDLAQAFEEESQRTIRGEFVAALFRDPDFSEQPYIKINNAVIEGDIKADGLDIPFAVECTNCVFTGRIELSNAVIRSFRMYNSRVAGAVRLGRAVISEDLALYDSVYDGAVILFGTNIGGSFYAANSQFNGTQAEPDTKYAFELWKTQVAQTTEFRNATIKGDAMFEGAVFGGNLILDGVIFERTSNFKDVRVVNFLSAIGATFQDSSSFESGIVERDANFSNTVFSGNVKFDYLTTARFLDFDNAVFNKGLSFQYAEAGWLDFNRATFNEGVDFTGVHVDNNMDFTGAAYTYSDDPFSVRLATVDGAALFNQFSAPAGLSLANDQFGDLEISGADSTFALLELTASKINSSLFIDTINADEFLAAEFSAEDSTIFQSFTVNKTLDMSNASIGFFTMKQFSGPADPDSFNLRGMQYADIGLVDSELTDTTWTVLLDMLENSAYSPQSYRTLSQFLLDKGYPEWAAEVEIARKNRERDKILTPLSAPWFWSWFLYLFSGYGQKPVLAFVWSALVIVIGSLVYRKEDGMDVVDDEVVIPAYNPLLYSFDLFLPYIELGIADKWDPKPGRKAAWLYKSIHQLLGWVLMPIALLTFGGIIG
jgi:hypothetical protein